MRLVLGLSLVLAALPALGQSPEPWVFERIHSGDGLSHNSVYAIHQDREGFLWFGTVDGLNRYDGYEFVVHRHDPTDPATLSHNLVRTLHEDADGSLWVGTQAGIDRLVVGTPGFRRYEVPARRGSNEREVYHLTRGPDSTLWAATAAGLLRLDAEADRFRLVHAEAESVVEHVEVRREAIWLRVAGGSEAIVRLDPRTFAITGRWRVPDAWIDSHWFHLDASGELWLGPSGPAERRSDQLVSTEESRASAVFAFEVDEDGALLIGSGGGGLNRCDPETAVCTRQLVDPDRPTWLHNYTRAIHRDRSGAIWVGTYGGVYRMSPSRKPFTLLRHASGQAANDAVSAIARTPEGTLWVGTFGSGLSRLDPESGRLVAVPGISQTVVWALHVDEGGTLWVGADGLYRKPPRGRFERIGSGAVADWSSVTHLASGPSGSVWVAGFWGLGRYDPSRDHFTEYPVTGDEQGPSLIGVVSLAVTEEALWLGLEGGEVNRLDYRTGRFERIALTGAEGEAAYDVHLGDPHVWVATGAGLFRYDRRTGEADHLTTAEGLPGSVVYSIQPDKSGHLWLGTNRGVARLTPATGAIRAFGLSDGIGTMEFNRHARFRDADGTLYLGGGEGLLRFRPESIRDDQRPPPVVLTAIESASRDGVTRYEPRGRARLVLPPGETTATFTFAALGFTAPLRQRYRYILEGFDETWVEAGTQRQARYTNLPPGTYTLRVRAANADGVWNETGLSLPVVVRPAFWQTGWFKLLVVLALVAGLAVAYRARVQRLLALERLRLRIASDLHDDLAGDLSGIALAADLLRQGAGDADRARLGEIRDTASGMVDALRDIVWTINPEHDTLEALVRRMRYVARQLLATHELAFTADLPDEPREVPMPVRHDLLLLYKEALHNVHRHAEAGRVSVELGRENGMLVLTVEDDGRGFDATRASEGHGFRSMRQRAERMGGTLAIESVPGRGTQLVARVPLARTRDGRQRARPLS